MDAGEFRAGNAAAGLEFLGRFDSIFKVLEPSAKAGGLSDAEIEVLVAQRDAAKKAAISPSPTGFGTSFWSRASCLKTPGAACAGRGSRS